MKLVSWCNDWNLINANNGDGYGSKSHLSVEGTTGKTLCGKQYPSYKGFPSSTGICKKCLNSAYRKGYPKGFTRGLEEVPSAGSYGE